MKIKMLYSQPVAPNGVDVQVWRAGEIYDTNEPTARLLVGVGYAVLLDESLAPPDLEAIAEGEGLEVDKPKGSKNGKRVLVK